MPRTKLGRSPSPTDEAPPSIPGIDEAPSPPVDPLAELYKNDISRMARQFWLSIIPQQLGPAIQAWIQEPANRDEFSKTLSGIGFCDFFEEPDSALNGQSPPSIEESPETVEVQAQEVDQWNQPE